MNFKQDDTLYNELDINRSASSIDIKRAYHKLALKHHPDKGGNEDKFKKIKTAYEILSNSEKRAKYDKFGMQSLNNETNVQGNDIFNMFFSKSKMYYSKRKGKDTIHVLNVTLEDLYMGKIKKLKIQRKVISDTPMECINCNGLGHVVQTIRLPNFILKQVHQGCARCKSVGKICNFKNKSVILNVEIKKGMSIKDQIRFEGLGNESINLTTGDIIIKFNLIKHNTFILKNNDLIMKIRISLVEALCGVQFTVKHLDDRILNIKSSKDDIINLQNGKIPLRCIKNEGMPYNLNNKGDLIIAFIIEFPDSNCLDDEKKTTLTKILPKPIHNMNSSDNIVELQKCNDEMLNNISNLY